MTARILNLLLLVIELLALKRSLPGRGWKIFAFYTQLSNLAAAVSAFFCLLFGPTAAVVLLRYLSTCMLTMTVFVTVCVLIPMGGDPKKLLFSGSGLLVHLLCPILSGTSYFFAEPHPQSAAVIAVPVLLTLAYGLLMLRLNAHGRLKGPYPFFQVKDQPPRATVCWMAALTAAISIISYGIWIAG